MVVNAGREAILAAREETPKDRTYMLIPLGHAARG